MKFSFKHNGIVALKSGDSRIEDVVDIKKLHSIISKRDSKSKILGDQSWNGGF